MAIERSSGLLLHITSLPSRGGIGNLGTAAYEFADFLAAAGQTMWQILPVQPTGFGNSPYAGLSAFAGNPLLISLEVLAEWGWIGEDRLGNLSRCDYVCYDMAAEICLPLLREAAANFLKRSDRRHTHSGSSDLTQWARFEAFCAENAYWLDGFAAYSLLRREYQLAAWPQWPEDLARHDSKALHQFLEQRAFDVQIERAIQFAFDEQWHNLRSYCADRGIRLIGDVAIFVSYDSTDVWTHPEFFEIGEDLQPVRVAGVPPDYFSSTGQRWGNPLYRWDPIRASGFHWWTERIRRSLSLYDYIRLDHFRGFEAYWAIPAAETTAERGEWVKAPGVQLFQKLGQEFDRLPFIAEDLGLITPEVDAMREQFGFPGMRVLQFGFGGPGAHLYLPHRYDRNTVVYTGTHDNDTTLGWWRGVGERERQEVRDYLAPCGDREEEVVWSMIRAASRSVADLCLFPVQDLLVLGSEARMNTPARSEGNWTWRLTPGALTPELAQKLAALTKVTDRTRSERQS